ncbi:hypothetical protein Bbelb_203620 [Branchiostoma belcheri]|nr:hypothetical protein Bbelb_203620 [Branchiostoma belcheri]
MTNSAVTRAGTIGLCNDWVRYVGGRPYVRPEKLFDRKRRRLEEARISSFLRICIAGRGLAAAQMTSAHVGVWEHNEAIHSPPTAASSGVGSPRTAANLRSVTWKSQPSTMKSGSAMLALATLALISAATSLETAGTDSTASTETW